MPYQKQKCSTNFIVYIQMSKSLIILAIGSIFTAGLSLVKLNDQLKKSRQKKQGENPESSPTKTGVKKGPISSTTLQQSETDNEGRKNNIQQLNLYEDGVVDSSLHSLRISRPIHDQNISNLSYYILLNLNKSKKYEGIIKIRFSYNHSPLSKTDLRVYFRGNQVMHVSVNSQIIPEDELIYSKHEIVIKKQLLNNAQNQITIVFENNYAFMGDGLASYFPLDQNNKYSLKQQVIYARNGFYKIGKIFPCFNILNECTVRLQVLSPNGFNVQANSQKTAMKIVTKKDYPLYDFLFKKTEFQLKSPRKLNSSTGSQGLSKMVQSILTKTRSQFKQLKLASIHDFFIFCSTVVEIKPSRNLSKSRSISSMVKETMKQVKIRYFSKELTVGKTASFISVIQCQFVQIFQRIQQYRKSNSNLPNYEEKIDVFIVNDQRIEGDFYAGCVLLSQKTVKKGILDRKTYYLLCRSVIGIILKSKKRKNLVSFESIIKLNELTLQIFPECCDFIFVKNKQYEDIRNQCIIQMKKKQQMLEQGGQNGDQIQMDMIQWMLEYYQQEHRYIIANPQKFSNRLSLDVHHILQALDSMQNQQYWAFFTAKHALLQNSVSQILIKISINYKGIPKSISELSYYHQNFIRSQHYLQFFSLKQIQNNLKRFIDLKCENLEKVLPQIRMKQHLLHLIPEELEGFLNLNHNIKDCRKLYQQFKRFDEQANFHHFSALQRQIYRIKCLTGGQIVQQYKPLSCDLYSWKLLALLKIYPSCQHSRNIIIQLEAMKRGNKMDKYQPLQTQIKPNFNQQKTQPTVMQQAQILEQLMNQQLNINI